jgi:hypothetical protein
MSVKNFSSPTTGSGVAAIACLWTKDDYVLATGGGQPRLERRIIMALSICWLNDLAKAKDIARQTKKPVFLDFFNPQ